MECGPRVHELGYPRPTRTTLWPCALRGGTSYAACTLYIAGGAWWCCLLYPYAERFYSGTDSSPLGGGQGGGTLILLFPVGYPELLPLFIAAAGGCLGLFQGDELGWFWAEALRRTMYCRTRCCRRARRLGPPLRRTRPAATGSRRSARGGRGATRASRAACTALPARRYAA